MSNNKQIQALLKVGMQATKRIMINNKTHIDHNQPQTIPIIIFDKILKNIKILRYKSQMRLKIRQKNIKVIKFQMPF